MRPGSQHLRVSNERVTSLSKFLWVQNSEILALDTDTLRHCQLSRHQQQSDCSALIMKAKFLVLGHMIMGSPQKALLGFTGGNVQLNSAVHLPTDYQVPAYRAQSIVKGKASGHRGGMSAPSWGQRSREQGPHRISEMVRKKSQFK